MVNAIRLYVTTEVHDVLHMFRRPGIQFPNVSERNSRIHMKYIKEQRKDSPTVDSEEQKPVRTKVVVRGEN